MWNTYRPGGEFAQDTTNEVASATQGGQGSLEDYFTNVGKRTGAGTTPQMAASAEEASRASRRDAAQELTQADTQRLAALGHAQEYYSGGLGSIPGMYGSQYATSVGGANSAMGNATEAAKFRGSGTHSVQPSPASLAKDWREATSARPKNWDDALAIRQFLKSDCE